MAQVAEKLGWAEDDARDEKISGEGLNNIREVAAQRTLDLTTELHAHNFNELLDLISKTKNVAQVAEKLGWAEDDARNGLISGEGLNNIREVAAQRTLDLTTELHARNFNELLDLISKTKNVAQVAEKLGWAEDDARDGKISEIQLLRIRQAASSRENELNEDI